MQKIPVAGPSITEKEIRYVTDAVTNAWYSNANMYHDRFEKAFAAYIGRKYCIALPSCTSALHLALASAGVTIGDEVIVPDLTWIATAAPISYMGATPVFVDVDSKTWCLDAKSFEANITPLTKAVITVNLYGSMPDMDAISDIAQRHKVAVIEDAAESIGSLYKDRKAGSFGLASTFSFHGSKTLTTGEGGMLATDDEEFHRRCLFLRDHGRARGDKMFWNDAVAYKYKMSSLQAALGLAQIERVEELVSYKRQIFGWYQEELKDVEGITLNYEPPVVKNSFWMVTIILDSGLGITKEQLMKDLAEKNIDSRPFFYPLSLLPAYQSLPQAKSARERNVVSYRISPYGLNLPSGLNITHDHVIYITKNLKDILAAKRSTAKHTSP